MSKATNQTVTLLSIMAGIMKTLRETQAFGRVDMQQALDTAFQDICDAVLLWPCSGDEVKNLAWRQARFTEWTQFVEEDKSEYNTAMMLSICDRIVCDLQARIKDPQKLQVIQQLAEPVNAFMQYSDPLGQNFPAFESSGRIMDKLYNIIDWRW